MSRHSRSRSRSKGPTKTTKFKAGKVTRNPFFNFMREFRKKSKLGNILDIAKEGAQVWNSMNSRDKSPYFKEAAEASGSRRRRRRARRSRGRRGRRRRSGKRRHRSASPFSEEEGLSDTDNEPHDVEQRSRSSEEVGRSSQPKLVELPPDGQNDQIMG